MEPYYLVTDPHDVVAVNATRNRKSDYLLWKEIRPKLEDDFDISCHILASRTGLSERRTRDISMALYRLEELPRTQLLQETYYFLDFSRLITIDAVLSKLGEVDSSVLLRIDAELEKYFTPTKPGQIFPSNASLRRKLNALITMESPDTMGDKKSEEENKRNDSYFIYPTANGKAGLNVEFKEDVLILLDEVVQRTAEEHGISRADALAQLILGTVEDKSQVHLYMYRASDVKTAPGFIKGYGWIHPDTADRLTPTTNWDMDQAAMRVSPAYSTPPLVGAYVEGRDGVCRWPGCNRPAYSCQKDHRIDFSEGGKTTAGNLASLCQHHHNIKTDRSAFYIMDPHSGDIVWLFQDGRWEYDEPQGPLATKNKNWALTVAQAIAARRRNAAKERTDT
ncbi:HNH endonuclease [Corynebacterium macginleyi]|uniref:HNH endonuclease signature motif containing protein n=1 Tax=Corynebacterium macginleyi TaxID=38290 RepID=UPI00190C0086|nr:HNH endonuclease signature motif containing protein [Corynebacterium macginleyi]MBK4160625.1 HNH endonuclease [Corynebacterium macginleyi]MBK4175013.1 HNH endonuclease [Corynebacterium macginleyi]MBK4183561.1 HNH endonuclease [Corynebacterium macginleyi]